METGVRRQLYMRLLRPPHVISCLFSHVSSYYLHDVFYRSFLVALLFSFLSLSVSSIASSTFRFCSFFFSSFLSVLSGPLFFFLLTSLSIMFYFLFLCGNDEAYVYSFHCRSPRSIIFPFVKEIHDRGPRK